MFNIFKRTRMEEWERQMLLHIFAVLPVEYGIFVDQLKAGMLKKVRIYNDPSNYVGFSYDPDIASTYEDDTAPHISLSGIKVFDKKLRRFCEVEITFMHGLIAGYSTPEIQKIDPDLNNIIIRGLKKTYHNSDSFLILKQKLSESELLLVNPSDVYVIELDGNQFYHLKDIGDGDFIAIDDQKKIYRITHDPYEIVQIDANLNEVLKEKLL